MLPLGTGNDLARVFGWGGGYSGEKISRILHSVAMAKPVPMDRWKLAVNHLHDVCNLLIFYSF